MVSFLGLAFIVSAVVAVVVIAVLAGSLVGDTDRRRCTRCGATIPAAVEECTVCEAPFDDAGVAGVPPPEGDEKPPSRIRVDAGTRDGDGWINPGVTQGMIKGALIVMALGLGVRFLGMLDPVGLTIPVPDAVMAGLTVIGGIAAFLGFVVLDIA